MQIWAFVSKFLQRRHKNFANRKNFLASFQKERIAMAKIAQNLVILIDPSRAPYHAGYKAGNMCLNRFTIDEDAAFELSGVYDLKFTSNKIDLKKDGLRLSSREKYMAAQGMGYLSFQSKLSDCYLT